MAESARLEYPVKLYGVEVDAHVRVGAYTYINRYSRIHVHSKIGRYCAIARSVEVGPPEHPSGWLSISPFQYNGHHFDEVEGYTDLPSRKWQSAAPCVIGNDVWIGAKAVIRRGVSIGDGAIIGAGSFVNKDVPPYAIVCGSPAKIVRYRFSQDVIRRLLDLEWWTLSPFEMAGVTFENAEAAIEEIIRIKSGQR